MLHEAEASGLFVAGFVSYEAAPAFDSALKTHSLDGFPLLCLGLFSAPTVLKDIEELPYDEVAAILCCPMGTVKSRINRARMLLR